MSDFAKSYLEASLARGDETTGTVIRAAWEKGARFDSWTEQFKAEAWAAAFEETGSSPEAVATTALRREQALPWDVVDGVPGHDFLWGEWEKARRGEPSGDCRWDGCDDCGACTQVLGNDLETASSAGVDVVAVGQSLTDRVASAPGPEPGTRGDIALVGRYVACFSVTGRGRFLGHLDRMEAFRRAVRRAGGHLALSKGMRPKPLLSLALPLGVGIEGLGELCEFELAEPPPEDFEERLAEALPGSMHLQSLQPCEGGRKLAARVCGVTYQVRFFAARPRDDDELGEPVVDVEGALAQAVRHIQEAEALMVTDVREGRIRTVDLKLYLLDLGMRREPEGGWILEFVAAVRPTGTARPELVLKALEQTSGVTPNSPAICRTRIHLN
jgi:radical SAM-linked protein